MNRIQESMEQLQASQELKKSTLQYLEQKRAQKNRFSWQPAFGLLAAAACLREAHQHEMSFGKYRAYLELLEYDENVSVEDCHGMTIGEIQNRIDSCQQNHGKGGHGRHKGHHGNASGH